MALHSRDAITVVAAVATRARADCSNIEGHTSLRTALVNELLFHLLISDYTDIRWRMRYISATFCVLIFAEY